MRRALLLALSTLVMGLGCKARKPGPKADLRASSVSDQLKAVGALVWALPNRKPTYHCTATLVSFDLALTAGHCLPRDRQHLAVAFGKSSAAPALLVRVKDMVRHPHFRPPSADGFGDVHDLGLLRLQHPVDVTPISLGSSVEKADMLHVVAFGERQDRVRGSRHLAKVSLLLSGSSERLVGDPPRKPVCAGDSGGAVTATRRGKKFLIGVVSRAPHSPRRTRCGSAIVTWLPAHSAFLAAIRGRP